MLGHQVMHGERPRQPVRFDEDHGLAFPQQAVRTPQRVRLAAFDVELDEADRLATTGGVKRGHGHLGARSVPADRRAAEVSLWDVDPRRPGRRSQRLGPDVDVAFGRGGRIAFQNSPVGRHRLEAQHLAPRSHGGREGARMGAEATAPVHHDVAFGHEAYQHVQLELRPFAVGAKRVGQKVALGRHPERPVAAANLIQRNVRFLHVPPRRPDSHQDDRPGPSSPPLSRTVSAQRTTRSAPQFERPSARAHTERAAALPA